MSCSFVGPVFDTWWWLVRGVQTVKLPGWHPAPPRKAFHSSDTHLPGLLVNNILHTLALPFLHHHKEGHRHAMEDHHLISGVPPPAALGGFIRFVKSRIPWAVSAPPHPAWWAKTKTSSTTFVKLRVLCHCSVTPAIFCP